MRFLVSCVLIGCAPAKDPDILIVRVPSDAYGPFDASVALVADAGSEARAPIVRQPHVAVDCVEYAGDEAFEPKDRAPPPFDNCPLVARGGNFRPKETSERRARNRDLCCYERPKGRFITIEE